LKEDLLILDQNTLERHSLKTKHPFSAQKGNVLASGTVKLTLARPVSKNKWFLKGQIWTPNFARQSCSGHFVRER
jgi:hypothetical protein